MRARHLLITAIPLVFYILAAIGLATDWPNTALALLIGGIAVTIVVQIFERRKPAVIPTLTVEQATGLRTHRETLGEISAVRQLRAQHPGLSVIDATTVVRGL